jgi:hypothetical protein
MAVAFDAHPGLNTGNTGSHRERIVVGSAIFEGVSVGEIERVLQRSEVTG